MRVSLTRFAYTKMSIDLQKSNRCSRVRTRDKVLANDGMLIHFGFIWAVDSDLLTKSSCPITGDDHSSPLLVSPA